MTGIPTHTGNLEENGTENTLKSGWDFGNRDLPALVREVFFEDIYMQSTNMCKQIRADLQIL